MSGFVSEVCGVNKNGVVKILKKSSLKGEREQDTFEKIRDIIVDYTVYIPSTLADPKTSNDPPSGRFLTVGSSCANR
jgi:hypothetical protein